MVIAFVAIFSNRIFWKTNNDVDVDEDDDVDRKYWQPITTIARHLLDPLPRISAKQLTWSDQTGWKQAQFLWKISTKSNRYQASEKNGGS